MNKAALLEQLRSELEHNLKMALQAAQNTHSYATDPDNKAENKYDTRGLEASYLAGAQAKRVADLKESLTVITNLQLKSFAEDTPIAISALVALAASAKSVWVWILPKAGGHHLATDEKTVQVVTPDSPLGRALIAKTAGDEITVNGINYEIESVI